MRKSVVLVLFFIIPFATFSQTPIQFDDYFLDQTLRVDYYHIGDAKEEFITIDQLYLQGLWAGNPKHLIDPFNHGKYEIKVYDIASNRLIYSRGYATYFGEYTTTNPAIQGIKRTYHETVLIPCPKKPVLLVFERRNRQNILEPLFQYRIDPADYHINRENTDSGDWIYEALKNGHPHSKVDLAFLAEGYTAQEFDKFKQDVDRFIKALFAVAPYDRLKDRFNIYGVFRPSPESGVDQPREGIFKETSLNSSFNALDLDRYLLTEDNRTIHDIAACVPYDAIVILVNSPRYGGGGIYNFYAISTVDNQLSEEVFIHEFGHSFAGLGDEYYTSDVAYNEFYPPGVEPTDPNITALLDPENIKWKDLVSPGISIPTNWGKEEFEALQAELQKNRKEMREQLDKLEKSGAPKSKIDKVRADFQKKIDAINKQMDQVREKYRHLEDKVGAFEGAGYSAKGLYRPMMNCLMFGNRERKFCLVCQRAIQRMIEFYSE
ncbi:MAG: M64 family metallo-endopeptidase [candidate division KSB1 bacterium]|nr:M64 family metallo-endopeptidase [candidate division KSB1 bacterium]MDZ7402365.1 M64 family metallo-endopeptidase [candidate division KSB1 bacterium]